MRRRKTAFLCLGIIALLYFTDSSFGFGDDDQHLLGYEKVLKNAESNPFYKYGIYSSRIIAVTNPEVYLQGDMLFAELITTHSGYAQAYQEPVESRYLMSNSESMYLMEKFILDSEPFSFEMVDFAQYKIIPKEEMYGAEILLYPFIDERISPIHSTLKTKSITSIEAATLRYVKARIEGNSVDETFIIFTKERDAFLYCKGKFYGCLGEEIATETIKDPVLVFNEQVVWYPLMGRDDSAKSRELKAIVAVIATEDNLPSLGTVETKLVDQLKLVSDLKDSAQKKLASIYSIHYNGTIGSGKMTTMASLSGFGKKRIYQNLLITKIGNYLSPHTSYLSSLIGNEPDADLKTIETFYLKKVGTTKDWQKGAFSAWAHTWPCPLIENNVDDAFRTRGGHCLSQAMNLSAAFDLAGVENVFVNYLFNKGSHGIVIIPPLNTSFSNGLLQAQETYWKQKMVIEAGMIGDGLMVFSQNTLVDTNMFGAEAAGLHQKISKLSQEFLKAKLFVEYKEDCLYQKLELP